MASNVKPQIQCWKLWAVAAILLAPLVAWFVLDTAENHYLI